jgi:nucleoid DNA-binding protein
MLKSELISRAASVTGLDEKVVKEVFNAILGEITRALATEGKAVVHGFGTFESGETHARNAYIKGKGVIRIPAKVRVKFKPSHALINILTPDYRVR